MPSDLVLPFFKISHQQPVTMPSLEASTIMHFIVPVTWASVNVPSYINPRFRIVLPSQAILSEMLGAAGLDFCPGFFEVLKSEESGLGILC